MLGLTHPGAAELAARLVEIAPPGLERVFYSESGSTAVEIALKMAFQYWRQREGDLCRRTSFVCLTDGYHGDTSVMFIVGENIQGERLCRVTQECLYKSIALVRPGVRLSELARAI